MKNVKLPAVVASAFQSITEMHVVSPHCVSVVRNGVIFGVACEWPSQNMEYFYLNAFWLPLYIPTDVLYISYGQRLDGHRGQQWLIHESCTGGLISVIRANRERVAKELQSEDGLLNAAIQLDRRAHTVTTSELVSYTHLWIGNINRGLSQLRRLHKRLDPSIPWHMAMRDRIQMLLECPDAPSIQEHLTQWCRSTLRSIRVPIDLLSSS